MIAATAVVAMLAFFMLIRQQVGVTDRQFLRSMIPHHAGAILMCEQAAIQSTERKRLCATIEPGG
jgi:uncharacterized protein (DUF305 family)